MNGISHVSDKNGLFSHIPEYGSNPTYGKLHPQRSDLCSVAHTKTSRSYVDDEKTSICHVTTNQENRFYCRDGSKSLTIVQNPTNNLLPKITKNIKKVTFDKCDTAIP